MSGACGGKCEGRKSSAEREGGPELVAIARQLHANPDGRSPSLRTIAAALAARGVRYTKRAALFSLCCRFDAHRVTAGRKFPTFERPLAKPPPFAEISLARVRSWRFPPSRNARPRSHRNLQPVTRFALRRLKLLIGGGATWTLRQSYVVI